MPLTPFVQASIGVHLGAAIVAAASPSIWPWALAAVAADQVLLTGAGMWPQASLLGPNLHRLPPTGRPEIALTFDDGPDPAVTPRVLDMLARAGVCATFFCIGEAARAHPALIGEIARRGHQIENHTDTHPLHFAMLGPARLTREIARAQDILTALAGRPPIWVRAPAGIRSPLLQPVLARQNLGLASWTRRALDGVFGDPKAAMSRLTAGLAPGDILLMHDGRAAQTREGSAVVLSILPNLLAMMKELGLAGVTLDEAAAPSPPAQKTPASAAHA